MITAKEALEDLCSKVNIKYYIGDVAAKAIESACEKPNAKQPLKTNKKASD